MMYTRLLMLVLLSSLILFGKPTSAQKVLKNEEWQFVLNQIQSGEDAKDSLRLYKYLYLQADSLQKAQQKEIVRKEGVIVATQQQRNGCYTERTNLNEQMKAKDLIITTQKATIDKLAKPDKRFSFGVGVGYGYALTTSAVRCATITVGVQYTIFKF